MSRTRRQPRNRRGTTMVEFAMCFPVLLGFLFAIIEFSRVLQVQHTVRLAAFEGARAGVSLDSTTATVQARVLSSLAYTGVTNPTITVVPNPLTYNSPTITVTVSAKPAQNAWMTWYETSANVITSTITLDREVQSVSSP